MGVPNNLLGVWLREYDDLPGYNTDAIIDRMLQGKQNCMFLKCMDGLTWQGWIDGQLTPVRSIADATALMGQYQARGIDFCPVTVPRGRDPIKEAQEHGALFEACGAGCVDLEPYAGFWDGSPLNNIINYCAQLRASAPNAYLMLQPDPRNLGSIQFDSIYAYFNALAPQHYVGWASVGWTDVNAEVARAQSIMGYGLAYYPTLYVAERYDLAIAFANALKSSVPGFQLFSLSAMTDQALADFAQLAPQPAPAPTPEPPAPVADVGDAITEINTAVSALGRALQDLAT